MQARFLAKYSIKFRETMILMFPTRRIGVSFLSSVPMALRCCVWPMTLPEVTEDIDKVLEIGDRLELLVDKTTDMQGNTAMRFRKQARRFRNTVWWKNMKLMHRETSKEWRHRSVYKLMSQGNADNPPPSDCLLGDGFCLSRSDVTDVPITRTRHVSTKFDLRCSYTNLRDSINSASVCSPVFLVTGRC